MIQEIPLQKLPDQTVDVTLDGQDCTIRVRQIGTRVYVSVAVDNRSVVDNAIGLNYTAINPYPCKEFSGILFFFDNGGDEPPEWEALGSRWKLLFVPESERRFQRFSAEG